MYKAIALITLLVLAVSAQAHGKNFKVKSIKLNPGQAVLVDQETGEQWPVKEGDTIDRWTVRKIERTRVLLFHKVNDHRGEVAVVPVVPMTEEGIHEE